MMNNRLFCMVLGGLVLVGSSSSFSADGQGSGGALASGVGAVDSEPYRQECGKCHVPYPAGLLPALSWEKMMMGLQDHFGQAVKLSPQSERAIYSYLLTNAAGRVSYRVSDSIMSTLGSNPAPLRVTEIPYFRQRHAELKDAAALGACDNCHGKMETGDFSVTGSE
jgi:hypothetical protein